MQLSVNQALERAMSFHKNGEFSKAQAHYLAILASDRMHPDANHNYGVLLKNTGRYQNSVPYFEFAITVNPFSQTFWKSLITCLTFYNRREEAQKQIMRAEELFHICGLDANLGDPSRAVLPFENENFSEALEVEIKSLIHLSVDVASQRISEIVTTNQFCKKSLTLCGLVLLHFNNFIEALKLFDTCICLDPNDAKSYFHKGNALRLMDRLKEASICYELSANLRPEFWDAHTNLGNIQLALSQFDRAYVSLSKVLRHNSGSASAMQNLANYYRRVGSPHEAIKLMARALKIDPKRDEIHGNLGITWAEIGEKQKAIDCFLTAIEINERKGSYHRFKVKIDDNLNAEKHILQMEQLLQEELQNADRCELHFALAKAFEKKGDFENSFDHYQKANSLKKNSLNYSITQDTQEFKIIQRNCETSSGAKLSINGRDKQSMPIFVVGMMRSGTSLVEQILDCHSDVTGLGELDYVTMFGRPIIMGMQNISTDHIKLFRNNYLNALSLHNLNTRYFVDKMPTNFKYLELMIRAFPEAHFIHVQRDKRAVCWSNYTQCYVTNAHGYCYDIGDLLEYYDLYEGIMDFWEQKYPHTLKHVNYEDLTVNPSRVIPDLLDTLNLKFEPNCLEPENNKRVAFTASRDQVKKKIYSGSSDAWRKFEKFLGNNFTC